MNTRYGADDRTRTCTAMPEEPKSTESTNSTTSAYSVKKLPEEKVQIQAEQSKAND